MHRFKVNMNGDTAETLKEQHAAVLSAAKELRKALQEATPNARNYQTNLKETDLMDDRMDHASMVRNLNEIESWAEAGAMRAMGMSDV